MGYQSRDVLHHNCCSTLFFRCSLEPVGLTGQAKPEGNQMAEKVPEKKHKGLVIVNTGEGKGKSTAAFGMMLRAWGRGMRVAAVQFIKGDTSKFGEHMAFEKMGVEVIPAGRGFTWTSHNLDVDAEKARHGWKVASEMILSGNYEVMVLDEITYPLRYGWIEVADVIKVLGRRAPMMHVVLTGRNAPQELVEFADLVTEMDPVKHPYAEQGITAQKGVEY
jgi:cob(I)alamin adenosyltransferase